MICDRYKFTAMARDGARDVDLDVIEQTYSFAPEPDLTLYFDIPADVGYDRIVAGRPSLKWYEAGLDMGWTFDPFESYKILQGKIKEIYDGLVVKNRIERIEAMGSVSEVQARVRSIFESKIDLKSVDLIDDSDLSAESLRRSTINWKELEQGRNRND